MGGVVYRISKFAKVHDGGQSWRVKKRKLGAIGTVTHLSTHRNDEILTLMQSKVVMRRLDGISIEPVESLA